MAFLQVLASSPVNKVFSRFLRPCTTSLTDVNVNAARSLAISTVKPAVKLRNRSLIDGLPCYDRAKGPRLGLHAGPVGARSMYRGQPKDLQETGIQKVKLADAEGVVEVEWSAGGASGYPYVWLRDNCQCPKCYDAEYNNRVITMSDLDVDVAPVRAEVRGSGSTLQVCWPDGHQSRYNWQWLRDRCFSTQAREHRDKHWRRKKQLWGAELSTNLPRADFPALLTDDRALYDFLYLLDTIGLVLVHDVPRRVGEVEKLANRVAFLKLTVYGTEYEVKSKPSNDVGESVADTAGQLELHHDEPYYSYAPGVMFLHFIEQTRGEGGTSQLADGFNAAYQLKEENPEAFRLLSTYKVPYVQKRAKHKSFLRHECPVIGLDDQGEVQRVAHMTISRDSFMDIPVDQVRPYYRALKVFNATLHHPKNCIHLRMKEGEMFVLNNLRTLHGRTAFNQAHGVRHLQGGYLDWDEIYSRMRVLQADLGIQD